MQPGYLSIQATYLFTPDVRPVSGRITDHADNVSNEHHDHDKWGNIFPTDKPEDVRTFSCHVFNVI